VKRLTQGVALQIGYIKNVFHSAGERNVFFQKYLVSEASIME
jgi:hypothetical protein